VIAREIKDRQGEGTSLGNLGLAYQFLGDYAKAIEYHQQSLAIKREIKDRQGEGTSLGNLGVAYQSLGDYAKAIEYHQQSLAIKREIKDRRGEESSLGNLGLAYQSLGDYAKAIEHYQQSLAIAREIKNRLGEGTSLGNLGNAYYFLGDYTRAIEYQQQSLAIAKGIKDRQGEGVSLGNLGNAYYSLRDYDRAIEYQQQSLAIAREIKERKGEGVSLGNLGNAYDSLGDYARAIEYHQQSLAIAREIGGKYEEGVALNNLGLALFNSNNLTQAETTLRTGIEVWKSQRAKLGNNDAYKVSIFEEQARTYHLLQEVLIAQNKKDAGLEIAEAGRAQALADLLVRRLSANPTEQSPITSPTIAQIKQIAKEQNATLVQYSIIPNKSLYIWVVKPTGEIVFRSVNFNTKDSDQTELINTVVSGNGAVIRGTPQDTVVPELLAETRSALGVGRYATIEVEHKGAITSSQRLQQLHQLLIEPIADLLPTKPEERVVFMPQGGLFLVPFAALQDKNRDYLIEKHTISIAPSIQVLDLTRKQQQVRASRQTQVRGNEVLIVGNPTMPQLPQIPGLEPIKLSPLPGAEQEALEIADFFGTQAITGNAATEKAIAQKLPNARIIHLATHGLLEYGNPQDSGVRDLPGAIALAPSTPDDGLLTSAEIFEMNLQAELVVLSACDTGQGKIRADGVVGLSRSLIKAGVPSTLVSLWSVPDAPTAELMTEFYRQWQQNSDKAQALRQAMLATMQTHPSPRDWAAFTLIGEAE
jgi:CHAT domain-containing protein